MSDRLSTIAPQTFKRSTLPGQVIAGNPLVLLGADFQGGFTATGDITIMGSIDLVGENPIPSFSINGEPIAGGGTGTPAGSNGEIQFNDDGVFGASNQMLWDGAFLRLLDSTRSLQLSLGSFSDFGIFVGMESSGFLMLQSAQGTLLRAGSSSSKMEILPSGNITFNSDSIGQMGLFVPNGNFGIGNFVATPPAFRLEVKGDVNILDPGGAGGFAYRINGVPIGGGGGGTPAGANTQIQYNANGAFGASDKFSITFGGDNDLYLISPGSGVQGRAWLHIRGNSVQLDYNRPNGIGGIVFENTASPDYSADLRQAAIYCAPNTSYPVSSKISLWTYSAYSTPTWNERMNISYLGVTINGPLGATNGAFDSRVDVGNSDEDNTMLWIRGRSANPDRNSNPPIYNSAVVLQVNGYLTMGAADYATNPYFPGPFWIQGYTGITSESWLDISLQPLGAKIGIGLLRPQYTLDVAGDVNITDPGGANGYAFRINGAPMAMLSQTEYDALQTRLGALEARLA